MQAWPVFEQKFFEAEKWTRASQHERTDGVFLKVLTTVLLGFTLVELTRSLLSFFALLSSVVLNSLALGYMAGGVGSVARFGT